MNIPYIPKKLDCFISTIANFKESICYHAAELKEEPGRLYAAFHQRGSKPEIGKIPLEDLAGPYARCHYYRKDNERFADPAYQAYTKITHRIEDILIDRPGHSARINEIIGILTTEGEAEEEITIIIKTLIAEVLQFEYKELSDGEYIYFSERKASAERKKIYYGSLADEIKVQSDKISLLVSHGQTVGNFREHILRAMLKKCLPAKFNVATGFIEGISRQIDILVYDAQNYAPTFIEGDLVVVRRESVRAIIEVKSVLQSGNLQEALQFFFDISRLGIYKPDIPIFKGIFAFDTNYAESSSIANAIRNFHNEPYFEEQLQKDFYRQITYLFHEISCVTVLKKHSVFSKYVLANGNPEDHIIPVLYSISDQRKIDIQTTMFLSLLFDYLDVDLYAKRATAKAFSQLYMSSTADIVLETKLTEDDWFPQGASSHEHDFKQESVKERVKKVNQWFDGEIPSSDLLP